MIGRTVRKVELDGNVRKALAVYCERHGVFNAAEGIRLVIRELPEYKTLTEIPNPPTKTPNDEKLNDSQTQSTVD